MGTRNRNNQRNNQSFIEKAGDAALRGLKAFLRFCYRLGAPMCVFLVCAILFVIAVVIVITSRSAARQVRMADMTAPDLVAAQATAGMPDESYGQEPVPDGQEPAETEEAPSDPVMLEETPEIRIEKGSDGEEVLQVQQRLMKLGYLELDEPTSHFGNATREAVRFFQRQHELATDGIVGNQTYDLLMSSDAQKYVMKEGAEGKDIERFQDMLYELGYLDSNQITGYYGTDTVSAVMAFQKRNSLKEDGKAGEKTIAAINSSEARVSVEKEQEIEAEKKAAAAEAAKQSAEGRISAMIVAAKNQLGKPYVLGSKGPNEFDCSGLVYFCLRKAHVYCRRLDADGYSKTNSWKKITSLSEVKKGDLLFFTSDGSSSVGHVDIYIGSGDMIDASSANGKVVRRSCKTGYWKSHFTCARRPIS